MLSIAKGQTLAGSGTVLAVVLTDPSLGDALLRAPSTLSFALFSTQSGTLVQVFPATAGQKQSVDLTTHRLGVGRYFAAFTVPAEAPVGPAEIHWDYTMASGAEGEIVVAVEILTTPSLQPAGYCSVSDIRAEGVPAAASDARLLRAIAMASRYIETVTNRWFEPRYCTFTLDGDGGSVLPIPMPIIAIESVVVGDGLLDPTAYQIYARHLTDNMLGDEDDRAYPKLRMSSGRWPRGRKNIQVKGVFGYTDYDGSPAGKTPDMIRDVCITLAIQNVPKLSNRPATTGPVLHEATRDQQVTYGTTGITGAFTGDAQIDLILEAFMRPPSFTAA